MPQSGINLPRSEVTMDKLLLTLTLLAFSSGVLCNVAQNLTAGGPTADPELPRTKVLDDHVEFYNSQGCLHNVPGDYEKFTDKEAIKLYKQPAVTWNQARKVCTADGGQLAVLSSQLEGVLLVAWLKRENIAEAWIGIHDLFERGHWVTLTGESLASTGLDYWLSGKPDYPNGNEDCGALEYSGGFINLGCDHWRSYFCKINLC